MQEIIRNVSTLDRGQGDRIPVEQVYAAAKQLGDGAEFSSHDIARILNAREYKIRASIGWLLKRNQLVEVGYRLCSSPRTVHPYRVKQYRVKDEFGVSTDFGMLMSVFCK
jgi:hypothetical protein